MSLIKGVITSEIQQAYEKARKIVRRADGGIAKESLIHGTYYLGCCRNADIARWDAAKDVFVHWRQKSGEVFLEEIHCREDETYFDVFDPWLELELICGLNPIPVL